MSKVWVVIVRGEEEPDSVFSDGRKAQKRARELGGDSDAVALPFEVDAQLPDSGGPSSNASVAYIF